MSGTVSTCLIAILSKGVLTIIRKVEKMKSDNQAKNCILCKVSIQNIPKIAMALLTCLMSF